MVTPRFVPVDFDAHAYLREHLPSVLARTKPPADGAMFQVTVMDREDCDVAYRFAGETVEVLHAPRDDARLTLAFTSRDLGRLTHANFDIARAVRTGRIRALGDLGVLEWLAGALLEVARRPQPR